MSTRVSTRSENRITLVFVLPVGRINESDKGGEETLSFICVVEFSQISFCVCYIVWRQFKLKLCSSACIITDYAIGVVVNVSLTYLGHFDY